MKNLVMSILGDYTLIARVKEDNTVHEYVVAWKYDKESDSWSQGHYFTDLSEAVFYMEQKKMTKEQKRARLVKMMHDYIRMEIDDEFAYDDWTCIVPDQPLEEDFEFISQSLDEWRPVARMFGKVVKRYER